MNLNKRGARPTPHVSPLTRYIADEAHYNEVIARMGEVKRELWAGTADIKDVYIKQGRGEAAPLLGLWAELLERGVNVRLIHTARKFITSRTMVSFSSGLEEAIMTTMATRVWSAMSFSFSPLRKRRLFLWRK